MRGQNGPKEAGENGAGRPYLPAAVVVGLGRLGQKLLVFFSFLVFVFFPWGILRVIPLAVMVIVAGGIGCWV